MPLTPDTSLVLMLSLAYLAGLAVGWKIGTLQRVVSSIVTGVQ